VAEVTTDPADVTIKLRPVTTDTAREGVHSDQDADELRNAMVDEIIVRRERLGLVPSREVEAALRTVPRHLFAPGVLGQLQVRSGQRVLEIGSGGYPGPGRWNTPTDT
jgi:hypothetical protein